MILAGGYCWKLSLVLGEKRHFRFFSGNQCFPNLAEHQNQRVGQGRGVLIQILELASLRMEWTDSLWCLDLRL